MYRVEARSRVPLLIFRGDNPNPPHVWVLFHCRGTACRALVKPCPYNILMEITA